MEDTQYMENLHTAPDAGETQEKETPKEQPKEDQHSRAQRRRMERAQKENLQLQKKLAERNVKHMHEQIDSLRRVYSKGYEEFCTQNPGNDKKLRAVFLPFSVNMSEVGLAELIESSNNPDLNLIQRCMTPNNKSVRIMYLRMDIQMVFDKESDVQARPGVPEMVEETPDGNKMLTQLFYHALIPMEDESAEYQIFTKEKLLSDFISHMFCMGVDMQQMNNSKQWQNRLKDQTHQMDDKVAEVAEMFANIGEQNEKLQHS